MKGALCLWGVLGGVMERRNLGEVNLNLLVALDALLIEGSVTQAAGRLGITQSAMSHRLKALRALFDDPLFVRGEGGGLKATPLALSLSAPVARGLGELARVVRREVVFQPDTAERTFTLGMGDSFVVTLLPKLWARVQSVAPKVNVKVEGLHRKRVGQQLEEGDIDLVVTVRPQATLLPMLPGVGGLRQRFLRREGFACLVREGHPKVGGHLTLDDFCDIPHALISPQGAGDGVVDVALRAVGRSRRVAMRLPYFLAAPLMVANSDLLLTVPRRLATLFADSFALRLLEPPLPLPTFDVLGVWHERFDQEPANQWLRSLLWQVADG